MKTILNAQKIIDLYPQFAPVKILENEIEKIKGLGAKRNAFGNNSGFVSKTKNQADDTYHISGIASEYAVCLMFNLTINNIITPTKKTMNSGDVGPYEVRSSMGDTENRWDLMAAKSDCKEDRIYIHALTHWWTEYVFLTGWTYGRDILQSHKVVSAQHRKEKLYCIPCLELKSINDLLKIHFTSKER